eukprot:CAMPEP_0178906982 /NCGR_PEP_ID=MMETSP0786-20121207/7118_1 /TAXON_ID=186022 /ORGANISM="Thalassionema frauenfeldii, Strain CCMP 1798" /LENGTH=393 /DNA_ID=CAMNT_0020578731 /DNA_START=234 /DNA_END=1415 /DNA_ORIENTATION=-
MDHESSGESEELTELPTSNLLSDETLHNRSSLVSNSTLQAPLSVGKDFFGSIHSRPDNPFRIMPNMLTNPQRIQTATNDLVHQTPNYLLARPVHNATGHADQIHGQSNGRFSDYLKTALTPKNLAASEICANTPSSGSVVNQHETIDFSRGQHPTETLPISKKPCFSLGNSTQSLLQAGEQHFLSQIEMESEDKPSLKLFKGNQLSMESPLEASSLLDVIQLQSNFVQQKLEALGVPTGEKEINKGPDLSSMTEISRFGEVALVSSQSDLSLSSKIQDNFPTKLLRALKGLEESGGTDIASFLPDGRNFIIKDTTRFEKEVMARHFPRMKHFASFQRQLNLYDFERRTQPGFERGIYHHKLFNRDFPEFASRMRRRKIKGKSSMKNDFPTTTS